MTEDQKRSVAQSFILMPLLRQQETPFLCPV